MIKVSVLYPNKPGSHFDADYYVRLHMPMAVRLLGPALKEVSADIGVSGDTPGSSPPYAAIAHFTCESIEAFTKAFAPVADELQSDIPKYTDIEPVIQVGQINEFKIGQS